MVDMMQQKCSPQRDNPGKIIDFFIWKIRHKGVQKVETMARQSTKMFILERQLRENY
jgi:hypothetical protein